MQLGKGESALFGVLTVVLSGLEFMTCRVAFPLCGVSVRGGIAKALLYRQLVQIGSLLVCSGGLYVRVKRRFVSLIRKLVSFRTVPGRLVDVLSSYRRLGLEASKPLSQFVMPSS